MAIKLAAIDGKIIEPAPAQPIEKQPALIVIPVADRIRSYLAFAANNKYLNYDPLRIDVYRVVGAYECNASPPRPELALYYGRFIDVVAKAVEQPYFYPGESPITPHTLACGQIYKETLINLAQRPELTDLLGQ